MIRDRIANLFRRIANRLATVEVRIDDKSKGWTALVSRPNDRDHSEMAQLYRDALEATRRNPLAKTIIDITTDFVLGDGLRISSPEFTFNRYLERFWNHPLNRIDQRLQSISDELARSGDLFILLFRNEQDGMSYMRFVTKEQIVQIDTAENDWETEIAYYQVTDDPLNPIIWLSPAHPDSRDQDAVMLHYSINRPIGASFGEGDLDTVIPWLLKYSRMLEDRVRLHWAMRSFLWFVTVPTNKVETKQAEYAIPPEPGSIVVKDDAEDWDVKMPNLGAADARHDMQAVRHMIDAVGYPPHWRGEGGDANLATATAMQLRPERHLKRRQNYLAFILQDVIYASYSRAWQVGKVIARPPELAYDELFSVDSTDITRQDNQAMAEATKNLTAAYDQLFMHISPKKSNTLARLALKMVFKFAGEPQKDVIIDRIMEETTGDPQAGLAAVPEPYTNGQPKEIIRE